METLATITNKDGIQLRIKSKPVNAGKNVFGFCEIVVPYMLSVDAPIIGFKSEAIPFGIPSAEKPKFTNHMGSWVQIGGSKREDGLQDGAKWLITEDARYRINRQISKYVRANPTQFGLSPKVDLAKEPTTNINTTPAPQPELFDEFNRT